MLGRVFMGRYETIRLLGEGGMGRVYLARQLDLGRQVVVKVMHDHIAADPKFRERFTRETLLMARFQHPYAVTLYDASLNDPQGSCIVMEYIRGITLDQVLQSNGRLTPARVGRLLYQLCEVLQAAHALGIIHRDLKPSNLMIVDANTPYELLKVMDFGLAKMLTPDQFAKITQTHTEFAVGTPGYMCPEQARGDDMDGRGDLYSVGVILYELLSGRLPFAGRSTMDLLLAHVTEEPPPLSFGEATLDVPPAIEDVVRRCLAKTPDGRPRSARELAELYEAALTEAPASTPSPTRGERPASAGWSSLNQPADAGRSPESASAQRQGQMNRTLAVPIPSPIPMSKGEEGEPDDPFAVVHVLEAWMPESIAEYKLRGFIHDVGGDVIESIPGRIRVRFGGRGSVYTAPRQGLSFLGIGRRTNNIDMELRMEHADSSRGNQLRITVLFRSPGTDLNANLPWRNLCTQIFCDLRGYLMGQTGAVGAATE
ncbi:MAG TPA: serine/threonine-protein kinase [Gemmataceae bacterium]|nr:serine/threonine-protein kinase [Gemmataceae bacterium]